MSEQKSMETEIQLLRQEVEDIKMIIHYFKLDLRSLRELFNGSIKSTVKVSEALRDGLIEMENRITDMESKKGSL